MLKRDIYVGKVGEILRPVGRIIGSLSTDAHNRRSVAECFRMGMVRLRLRREG